MTPAPIPIDESARLEDLRGYLILDTPADERFDLFTRLSTWLFDVPVSAINFVDESRTFFKSLIGFERYPPARSTSICAHAIGSGAPLMMVEDLARDSRFQDHPLLITRGIRFYAGSVLYSAAGHALGTLCIGDTRPRLLGPEEQARLMEMAKGVGAVLDLHRAGVLLLRAATQDALTGLANRRLFSEQLQEAMASGGPDRCCTLICLDLDHFKDINDSYGHAAGDALLCEVGYRLRRTVRDGDLVARLGGDEFTIMMGNLATLEAAHQLARRILAAFAEPFAYEGHDVVIRSSIGIARCPDHAADAAFLLRCADAALYEAKQAGRGQCRVYSAELGVLPRRRQAPPLPEPLAS